MCRTLSRHKKSETRISTLFQANRKIKMRKTSWMSSDAVNVSCEIFRRLHKWRTWNRKMKYYSSRRRPLIKTASYTGKLLAMWQLKCTETSHSSWNGKKKNKNSSRRATLNTSDLSKKFKKTFRALNTHLTANITWISSWYKFLGARRARIATEEEETRRSDLEQLSIRSKSEKTALDTQREHHKWIQTLHPLPRSQLLKSKVNCDLWTSSLLQTKSKHQTQTDAITIFCKCNNLAESAPGQWLERTIHPQQEMRTKKSLKQCQTLDGGKDQPNTLTLRKKF